VYGDPKTRITNLEDLRLKLEVMGSFMTDDQFMIQVLNTLINDYKIQMLLLEKRIESKENPLTIDELKEELSLRYERLLMKTEMAKFNNLVEQKAFLVTQFKGKCRNCGKIGHKAAQCKSKQMSVRDILCNQPFSFTR
jgi:ABC-type ATPase with predicted acetyltransferase domain